MTNIISTTKSGARPDPAIESPIASKTQPGLATEAPEANLESCINARRAALIFKLTEVRGSMHLEAVEAGDKIKARLSELSHIVKEGVIDGWGNLGESVKRKLDGWLADSAKQLAPQGGQS